MLVSRTKLGCDTKSTRQMWSPGSQEVCIEALQLDVDAIETVELVRFLVSLKLARVFYPNGSKVMGSTVVIRKK